MNISVPRILYELTLSVTRDPWTYVEVLVTSQRHGHGFNLRKKKIVAPVCYGVVRHYCVAVLSAPGIQVRTTGEKNWINRNWPKEHCITIKVTKCHHPMHEVSYTVLSIEKSMFNLLVVTLLSWKKRDYSHFPSDLVQANARLARSVLRVLSSEPISFNENFRTFPKSAQ